VPTPSPVVITAAVEGALDEAVLTRLVNQLGGTLGVVYGRNGKSTVLRRLRGYNHAARFSPWVVLIDLDEDAQCAPPYRAAVLPHTASLMCFRIAVREIEAWLLADPGRLAEFLGVTASRVPTHPESIQDPKRTMVDLARRSRRRDIREDMVPRPGSGRAVGPAYTSRLIEFVADSPRGWRPEVAARSSNSLERCLACLRRLTRG
jgi:hypothetical protein